MFDAEPPAPAVVLKQLVNEMMTARSAMLAEMR